MAKAKQVTKKRRRPPAATPEEREQRMVAMAMDLAEKQLEEGTASTQVITHFLKLGSTREVAEQNMIEKKTELVSAQVDNIESQKVVGELYQNAIDAMRLYTGNGDGHEDIF